MEKRMPLLVPVSIDGFRIMLLDRLTWKWKMFDQRDIAYLPMSTRAW